MNEKINRGIVFKFVNGMNEKITSPCEVDHTSLTERWMYISGTHTDQNLKKKKTRNSPIQYLETTEWNLILNNGLIHEIRVLLVLKRPEQIYWRKRLYVISQKTLKMEPHVLILCLYK